jgi:hypothetical protein
MLFVRLILFAAVSRVRTVPIKNTRKVTKKYALGPEIRLRPLASLYIQSYYSYRIASCVFSQLIVEGFQHCPTKGKTI